MRALTTAAIVMYLLVLFSVAQERSAGLTGKVTIFTGAELPGTIAELESEGAPTNRFRTVSGDAGVYSFSGLPSGYYTLRLSGPGFLPLTVKSIQILNGEQRTMPALQRAGPEVADCGVHGILDYVQLRPSVDNVGDLGGTVRVDEGLGKSELMLGAGVTLICSTGKACGSAKTDPSGEFLFTALPPGSFSVRVTTAGFYPQDSPPYRVTAGLESVYQPIYVEPCPRWNCDPKLPPKKPRSRCE